jgi:hypothetical protein
LVIALLFFVPSLILLAFTALLLLPPVALFVEGNVNHSVVVFAGIMIELSVLFLFLDLGTGPLAIFLGVCGLRAAGRLPGSIGRRQSMIGIVLGLLVLLWPSLRLLVLVMSGG